jgi:hypothetical protein
LEENDIGLIKILPENISGSTVEALEKSYSEYLSPRWRFAAIG